MIVKVNENIVCVYGIPSRIIIYFLMSGKLTDIFLSIESKKGFHVQQQYVFDYFYYFYTYYFQKRR